MMHFDTAGDPGLVPGSIPRVRTLAPSGDRGRVDFEELHVHFNRGRRFSPRVGIDKRQILALLVPEGFDQGRRQSHRYGLRRMRDLTDGHLLKPGGFGMHLTTCRHIRSVPSTRLSRLTRVRRILLRLEVHHVPKHASWLNLVFKVSASRFGCATTALPRPSGVLRRRTTPRERPTS